MVGDIDTRLLLAVLAITFYVYCLFRKRNRRLPPGPKGLPIFGYLPWIDAEKPFKTFKELSAIYGPLYSLQLGNIFTIVATDVRIIKKALSSDVFTARANLYLTHGIMDGYGIICAEGERWKIQRRFMISCLKNLGMVKRGPKRHALEIRLMAGVKEFLQVVEDGGSSELDITNPLLHCVGNIMNSLVFGRTWQENDPMWRKLRHLAEEGVKLIGVAGPINFLPILRFLPKYRRVIDFIMTGKNETHQYYQQVIDSHGDVLPDTREDMLTAFKKEMDQGREFFCQKQFYHFLADAFGAGLDTTVATLSWFLLFMALHPNIQKILQSMLDDAFVREKVNLATAESIPLLEACICETQRLRPVTPVGIPHSPKEDTYLNGYLIPKGAMFVPLIWSVHTDSHYWTDPYVFNPERFINSEKKIFRPENFIPFQTGKRSCIGGELSRMMLLLFFFKYPQIF